METRILAIVVTYNAMRWAERCFDSLENSNPRPDVFVSDNGSTDGTLDYIRSNHPSFIVCRNEKNLGFGQANNKGLKYALENDYSFVYLLNQDAWLLENTLQQLINISQKHQKYGVLSPFQMRAGLSRLDDSFALNVCPSNPDLLHNLYTNSVSPVYSVTNVMAAHWLITRACLETVGGFSPSFFHYAEDDNYVDRLRYHGFLAGIVPGARAVHDRAGRVWSKKKMMYVRSMWEIRRLSSPFGGGLNTWLWVFLNLCVLWPIKFASLKPVVYFIRILASSRVIIRNRKASRKPGPSFIQNK